MLPLLGNLPILLQGNLIEISEKLKATYGSIFSLSLGGKWVVFINGNECLREVFVKNAEFFSDRPKVFFIDKILESKGNLIEISEKLKATYGSIFSLSLGGKWVVFINGNECLREVFVKNAEFFSDRPKVFFIDKILESKGVIITLFLLQSRRPHGSPPGPIMLPLLGNLPILLQGNLIEISEKLKATYGSIFSLSLGGKWVVFINGNECLREVFVKNAEFFSDRPKVFFIDKILESKAVTAQNGLEWKTHRTFMVTALRNLGFGKKSMESKVLEETQHFLRVLSDSNGDPINVSDPIYVAVSNIICSIALGERFDYNDVEFKKLINVINELLSNQNIPAINLLPVLQYLPGDIFGAKRIIQQTHLLKKEFKRYIAEHKNTIDPGNSRDFIDEYIIEQKRKPGLTDDNSPMSFVDDNSPMSFVDDDFPISFVDDNSPISFVDDNSPISFVDDDFPISFVDDNFPIFFVDDDFPIAVFELFGAGTDTISNTLTWSVLYLLKNPDIQDRMIDELLCTIPTDRPPTMADKLNLPFCEAVIAETQRLANILPFALPHAATEDVMIGKFKILKGSFVIPNLSSVAHDEELFPDHLKFDPLRFIDKQGKFYGQERIVPFSLGKRTCPGESLARMELFLFITSMVKKFHILPEIDGIFPSSKGQLGIAYVPNPFKVRFVERN
ncbi:cytochrome P450 2C3-like [Mytilus edulis]|uniref:cytochrome P450 2C3-like n=1 Tax=Mytilus edulis TaxID=6550 RepID=UPI0039EECA51